MISSYSWNFDGETSTGATVSHTYHYAGVYTATLTIADASGLSHQSTMTITASAGSTILIPLTAVISSSAAVGMAPFTVTFDGSGSTGPQSIVSYSWAFGDGQSAAGIAVTHTFTAAGTYYVALTVTDSAGLLSQPVSTPVLVSAAPLQTNQPPISSFQASQSSGNKPLAVSFDGAGASDPDGIIISYAWNFGNGSSASGPSAQATYTEVGEYTVSLQVTDEKGATSISTQTISVLEAQAAIDFILSTAQVDQNWKVITFDKVFQTPVIVAGALSFNDDAPATVHIRHVTSTGFEACIQEWNYLDGKHAAETFSYIVMEKGVYTLPDGTKLEANSFSGTAAFQKISLQQSYMSDPVILTQVETLNDADTVGGRIRNINMSSFEYEMQEQEKNKPTHSSETVGYIAWEPGRGEFGGIYYEIGNTAKIVTNDWYDINFQSNFSSLPFLIASIETCSEDDTAALRSQSVSMIAARIKIEEEKSKDTETKHAAEMVGYMAFGAVNQ